MLWATVKEIWGSPVIVLMTESCHMDIAWLSRSSLLTDPTEMSQKKKKDFRDVYSEEDNSRAGNHCLNPVAKQKGK